MKGTLDRPRLSVYRSNENLYAQIIDDTTATTLVSCSTLDRNIMLNTKKRRTCDASRLLGETLAELSVKKNNLYKKKQYFKRSIYFDFKLELPKIH